MGPGCGPLSRRKWGRGCAQETGEGRQELQGQPLFLEPRSRELSSVVRGVWLPPGQSQEGQTGHPQSHTALEAGTEPLLMAEMPSGTTSLARAWEPWDPAAPPFNSGEINKLDGLSL